MPNKKTPLGQWGQALLLFNQPTERILRVQLTCIRGTANRMHSTNAARTSTAALPSAIRAHFLRAVTRYEVISEDGHCRSYIIPLNAFHACRDQVQGGWALLLFHQSTECIPCVQLPSTRRMGVVDWG